MMRAPLTAARTLGTLAVLLVVAVAVFAFALATGSVAVAPADVAAALHDDASGEAARVVRELRMPRALAAFAVGGLLALAGALMQVLLRNPLADPYVLGLSGGAAVGALAALVLGLAALVGPLAFAGAFASTLLVFALARGGAQAAWAPTRLLLTGVVVAAGWGALIALLLTLAPDAQVKGMVHWLLGDLSGATSAGAPLLVLAIVLAASLALARDLNAMAGSGAAAATLGVAVPKVSFALYVLASLATASAVTTAGAVGFVGLVVPHALRLGLGNDQRLLLPAAVLAGGALLVLADTFARSIAAPLELPVGVLTALIGVPMFLVLLRRAG
jgi:iron complex transport system permease protein